MKQTLARCSLAAILITLATSPLSVSADSLDWRSIRFKSGLPHAGESLELSLDHTSGDQFENIAKDVEILNLYPTVLYDIEGYASSSECSPAECMALSGRRAQLFYDFLMQRGVQPCRINAVIARGSNLKMSGPDESPAIDMSVQLLVARGSAC